MSRRRPCERLPAWVLALGLSGIDIPVRLSPWNEFRVWYNLAFLILLVPLTIAGAVFAHRFPERTAQAHLGT